LLRKIKVFTEETNIQITKIVLRLTLPAFLIASALVPRTMDIPREQTPIFFGIIILSFIITGIICAIFAYACVKKKDERGAYVMMGLVGNVNFMGLPFVNAFLGANAMVFATMYSLVFTLTTFTIGMKLIGGKNAKVSAGMIFSPVTVAAMIAVFLFLIDFRLPTYSEPFYFFGEVIRRASSSLGAVTSPMAMVILGSTLAGMKFKEMFGGWRIYAISVVRVIVVPIVLFFALLPFANGPYLQELLRVIIIINSTAMAISIVIIAVNYRANEKIIGQGIFISHLISLVTLPILLPWLFSLLV
jgi:predicted permease